ncbi:MAG: hypothetical protein KDC88_04250 [Ignavibacteriae bacterium]|nr:hypothetical protein [Ignavibacteriota bacterium]MCB9208785.1 hypothetical protein [Ignavibacteriales bacterium]MCB9260593.1 hypothetical protein [Ignavibacteriales bacterium]
MNIRKIYLSFINFIFICSYSFGQNYSVSGVNFDEHIYQKNPIEVLKSKYLNNQGIPTHEIFLKNNGIVKNIISNEIIPIFKITIDKKQISYSNNKINEIKLAEILNVDFYIQRIKKYKSQNSAENIWDGRVYLENNNLIVGGYSSKYNERPVGKIDLENNFIRPIEQQFAEQFPILNIPPDEILFDPFSFKLLQITQNSNDIVEEKTDEYLPIQISNEIGNHLQNMQFDILIDEKGMTLILNAKVSDQVIKISECKILESDIIDVINSYRPELIKGCIQPGNGEIETFILEGKFSNRISLVNDDIVIQEIKTISTEYENLEVIKSDIEIDGKFNDWHNVKGTSDFKGDRISYLYPNPDTDLLEFKVTNDDKYLYLYSRVVGAHGRTGEKGRYYWYAYIDVDSNPNTGYSPTRDDNCYFGIPIGDDCEAQFEFIGNKFVKTFFGFSGVGAEKEVLEGKLELGPSFYSATDRNGNKRDKYKIEYVNRDGKRYITHDYTEGTSEDIIIALSADASEVEMKVELKGFLKDVNGNPILSKGSIIDIAVGVEASSDYYNSDDWGADSSPVLYGYKIK